MKHINLALFRFETIGTGLKALNLYSESRVTQLIEASSLGEAGFWILLEGELEELQAYFRKVEGSDGLIEAEVFEEFDRRILDALFNLYSGPLNEEVVIAESDMILPLLNCCQRALSISGDIFEIKIDRGARGYNSAVLSGKSLSFLTEESFDSIELTHLNHLSEAVRNYFL